jgi:hypothetical protein
MACHEPVVPLCGGFEVFGNVEAVVLESPLSGRPAERLTVEGRCAGSRCPYRFGRVPMVSRFCQNDS